MKNFAVIENGIVVNCIVSDTKELAEELTGLTCIEYFIPQVGDQFNGTIFIPQT